MDAYIGNPYNCEKPIRMAVSLARKYMGWEFWMFLRYAVFLSLLVHSLLSFPIGFAYRYFTVSKMFKHNPFTRNKLILALMSVGIIDVYIGTGFYISVQPVSSATCANLSNTSAFFNRNKNFFYIFQPDIWRGIWYKKSTLAAMLSSLSVSFLLNIYFGFSTMRFLKKQIVVSDGTRRKIITTLKVITLQAILPPLMIVPIMLYFSFHVLTGLANHGEVNQMIIFTTFTSLPILDPIIPIYFFKTYKKGFLKLFRIPKKVTLQSADIGKMNEN